MARAQSLRLDDGLGRARPPRRPRRVPRQRPGALAHLLRPLDGQLPLRPDAARVLAGRDAPADRRLRWSLVADLDRGPRGADGAGPAGHLRAGLAEATPLDGGGGCSAHSAVLRRRAGPVSLRRTTVDATTWTAISFAVALVVQLGQFALLARLLDASEMGIIAIVGLLNAFVDIFLGMGVAQAIIQRRRATSFELSSVFWLNLSVGLAVTGVVFLTAGPIAALLGSAVAAPVLSVASLVFVGSAAGQVPRAVLEKGIRFRAVAVSETVSLVGGFVVTVFLAFSGTGALSYAWGLVATAALRSALALVQARRWFRLRLRFRIRETARFLSFGVFQTLDGIVNYLGSNASSLAIGRLLGPAQLGGYTLGYNLAVNLPARVNPIVTRVMFPVFSSIQHDRDRVARNYLSVTAVLSMASIPPLTLVALRSEDIVRLFYGPDWGWIAGMTSALTVVGAVRAIGNPVGFILMAMDRVRFGLVVNIAKTAITIPLIVGGGVLFGLDGLIGGLLVSSVIGFFVTYGVLRVVLGVRLGAFLRACVAGPLLAAPMAAVLLLLRLLPEGSLLRLFPVELALAGLVLAATVLLAPGRDLADARSLVLSRLPARFRPRSTNPVDVAVVLAAEERFDGSGGAVATWVRETVSRSQLRIVVHAPWSVPTPGVDVPRHLLYRRVYSAQRRVALLLARRRDSDPAAQLRRLSLGGRPWLLHLAPSLRRVPTVWIHNRPRYAVRLRRLGYRGRIVAHQHNDLLDHLPSDHVAARPYLDAVDEWIFCSEFLRERAVKRYGLRATAVLHNGVVPAVDRAPRPLGPVPEAVFAGRLVPEKGAREAVEILQRLNAAGREELRLVIAGASGLGDDATPTAYVRALDEAVSALPGTVRRLPFLRHEDLLELFASSALLLYPCRWDEPFGMVVVEALSRGLPVLTVERGGIPEILRTPDGVIDGSVLVAPGTGEEVAAAMIQALPRLLADLRDPIRREEIAEASRRRAAAFGWPDIARRADELLSAPRV
ncbi:colanic acid exporter [Rathayibacter rathayi]|uniref:Colanic acid exporter n=1 Tax=Rathayibacter rathayi TaxID=33887 RepID=A0ABD6WCZ8_RATRA|nr:colanic acid exporter [Rathayibacter rathayi]PPF16330.1 colanic acid exporter [Rathayibacter rathayi]PPF51903.1 colanic acid exporter [Rathayibacter rathayi]PPG72512.1 colanic acid exporter [Rathayibacter rathayi]PPG81178.1 colanic acid exporter [Rathayibacter rathayi]